jgi:uncharacterized membrane protein HdeD (DUF308 family)
MAVTLDPSAPVSARTHRGALSALSAAFLIGVVFIVKAAIPYFVSFTEAQYGPHWSRRWGLLAHITMGIVALLSGPSSCGWVSPIDGHYSTDASATST